MNVALKKSQRNIIHSTKRLFQSSIIKLQDESTTYMSKCDLNVVSRYENYKSKFTH